MTVFILSCFLSPLQKKPKIIEKDHGVTEVSKHSTSTETMFFEKVSIIIFSTSVYLRSCGIEIEIMTTKMLMTQSNHVQKKFNLVFLSPLKTLTGEEGSSELWGIWQLPAMSAHLQSGSHFTCWAGAVGHPISWVSLTNTHTLSVLRLHMPTDNLSLCKEHHVVVKYSVALTCFSICVHLFLILLLVLVSLINHWAVASLELSRQHRKYLLQGFLSDCWCVSVSENSRCVLICHIIDS